MIPEIHRTNPTVDNIPLLVHELRESPEGPGRYSASQSLASSPSLSSRGQTSGVGESSGNRHRSGVQTALLPQPSQSSHFSLSSSRSDRRLSQHSASSMGMLPGTRRGSPNPHHVSQLHASLRREGEISETRNLPSLSESVFGPNLSPHVQVQGPYYSSYNTSYREPYFSGAFDGQPMQQSPYQYYSNEPTQTLPYLKGPPMDRSTFPCTRGPGQYPVNFDTGEDLSDGKQKRRRGNLPKSVTDLLRAWFSEHIAHPYPTEEEKQLLMDRTGLTISQVSLCVLLCMTWVSVLNISQISNWFINARRRSLPQMTKQAQAEAELRETQHGTRQPKK